jgi:hypothetical protein
MTRRAIRIRPGNDPLILNHIRVPACGRNSPLLHFLQAPIVAHPSDSARHSLGFVSWRFCEVCISRFADSKGHVVFARAWTPPGLAYAIDSIEGRNSNSWMLKFTFFWFFVK